MGLAGMITAMLAGQPAAAAGTSPCSDPQLKSASVEATMKVRFQGADWPSFTSITQITAPAAWRGVKGLFGNGQDQENSLGCFIPVGQEDFQSAPPAIKVTPKDHGKSATVTITNTIVMSDSPEADPSWPEGSWQVEKHTWGYQVTFQAEIPPAASGYGSLKATLDAPGLNVMNPACYPATDKCRLAADDGKGKLTWDLPPPKKQPSSLSASLTGSWLVRMNLYSDRWPQRIFVDMSWTLKDGVLVDLVGLWTAFWIRRREHASDGERQLSSALLAGSFLSLSFYAIYIADNYLWHHTGGYVMWPWESIVLMTGAALYFWTAVFGVRRKKNLAFRWSLASALGAIGLSSATYFVGLPGGGLKVLVATLIILLAVLVFVNAGTVLWVVTLWPFGQKNPQDRLGELGTGPLRLKRAALPVLGMITLGSCILGQSVAASYYFWQRFDLWRPGQAGLARWLTSDLLNDVHWWIGDGMQWGLGFAVITGTFAALRVMSASKDVNLPLLAAITSSLFIGIWGFYDEAWGFYGGLSIPLPCIVMFVGLIGWGLARTPAKSEGRQPKDVNQLARGPDDTLWTDGMATVQAGKYLVLIPIGFDIYIAWNTGNLSLISFPFGLQDAIGTVISIVIGWLSGLFMFGVLVRYLRGNWRPVKGALFGLIAFASFASDAAVRQALHLTPNPIFVVDGLLAVSLFATTGLILDIEGFRKLGMTSGDIRKIYNLDTVRGVVTSITTLIVVALGIWQAIYLTGQTADQRAQTISDTSQFAHDAAGSNSGKN